MESLWSQTIQLPEQQMLEGDLRVQNVVIGGGIAGLLIAYMLQEKGQEVIVLEAKVVGSGQTQNTTAKITSQHGLIYADMIKNTSIERARGYAQANEKAIQKYKEIITKEGIACHFEELPSFLYTSKQEKIKQLKKEAEAARVLGIEAEYVQGNSITELPFGVAGAVRFERQAQFHPLEFIQGIIEKLTIYEHTKVWEVDEHFVITENGVIVAENVIFATHYPFPIVPGYYFLRQHQSRSYVLALKGENVPEKLGGMYYGIDRTGVSLRCAESRLILGGSSHRTGKSLIKEKVYHCGETSPIRVIRRQQKTGGFCSLREQAKQYYPQAKEVANWAAQDCMSHDSIPFIGRFSAKRENWYVATGFQKWGMSTAMVAAMIISDMIIGEKNVYEGVFSPQRLLIKAGWKHFIIDVGESIVGLGKGLLTDKKHRCRHMGCSLNWNEEERTWDCACHGSRYTENGDVMDNPAQTDLNKHS